MLFLIALRNSVKSQSIVETIFLTFYGSTNEKGKDYSCIGSGVIVYACNGGGCSSTKLDTSTKVSDSVTTTQEIVDWSNRNLDGEAKPEWLKKLVKGNDTLVRQEFGITADYVVKYSVASTKTRDSSMAASRVNYNAMRAEELKTKVVSEAAATLNNDGYTEATSNAATLAKVDLSGHELVTQFYQEILTVNKETGSQSKEFLCYSVYKISKENWANTLKGFLSQVIPSIPDSEAQVKMAQTIQSLYNDTAVSKEKSDTEILKEISEKLDNAQTAAQSASVQGKQAASDLDWMKALETGVGLLLDVAL